MLVSSNGNGGTTTPSKGGIVFAAASVQNWSHQDCAEAVLIQGSGHDIEVTQACASQRHTMLSLST